jgi:hypothetical protein
MFYFGWNSMMDQASDALATTQSSQIEDGSRPRIWRSDRVFTAKKTCKVCGETFRPWIKRSEADEVLSFMKEHLWDRQDHCSRSCSKKSQNPMYLENSREKMALTLRRIGHQPKVRGGNGCPLTGPQQALLDALGKGWIPEHVILTKQKSPYPHHYKADLANPSMMIVIEVDGRSHDARTRQEKDRKKDELLTSLGWLVFRVSNSTALNLCSTCKSPDILLSSLREYSFTIAT